MKIVATGMSLGYESGKWVMVMIRNSLSAFSEDVG
jgi:hypothetical protein